MCRKLSVFRSIESDTHGRSLKLFSSTLVQPLIECHSGLLFKSKSIGVDGRVLSICREFLSNRRQRDVVNCPTGKWILVLSWISSCASPNLAIPGVKFDSSLTF